ncbi:hypothetical protein Tsubulata_024976 [Turnera subulata]|uniref:UspA domain-containing protein n=1 Tax=Turnera subulata TaxID=218843 RepID=A0A9Q0FZ80_9ROSI|nr:hypothetical protein Tsubulata_024976 [Turnera subulata]
MGGETATARKVMVVADPSRESAGALQYALSHVVVENDELILVHVENPNSWKQTFSFLKRNNFGSSSSSSNPTNTPSEMGGGSGSAAGGGAGGADVDFLESMKQVCEIAQPKLRVRSIRVPMEAKDRASAILDRSQTLGVDILIIGQRRSLSTAILGSNKRRPGGAAMKLWLDTAEYLIENSKCTCVGVQKKGQNGGYLLNSKTHKNFWLLA